MNEKVFVRMDSNNKADEVNISASSMCEFMWIHGTSELEGSGEVAQTFLPLNETSIHETFQH